MTKGQKLAEMAKQAAYNQKLEQAYEAGIQYAVAQIEKQANLGKLVSGAGNMLGKAKKALTPAANRASEIPKNLKNILSSLINPAKSIPGLDQTGMTQVAGQVPSRLDLLKQLLTHGNAGKFAPELGAVAGGGVGAGIGINKAMQPEEPEGIAAILAGLRKKLGMD